jgi:gamma-glutamyl:cysteine ligase YbdK (ATP-grasp superfamily)
VRGGRVRFLLDNRETLVVADEDLRRVYDQLWRLAPQAGAVSTAAVVHAALRRSESALDLIELTATQSAVLRQAVALLDSDGS